MTSPTIATTDSIVRSGEEEFSSRTCSVCAHASAGHDAISERYCAATLANALSRNCICA